MKNNYLEKRRAEKQIYLDAGVQSGRQQIIDMLSLVLHDPEIMGQNTFGKKRLLKIVKAIGEKIDFFQQAWERTAETDYYRSLLDRELADAYGEELHDSFLKRYEFLSDFDYDKRKWKR